MAGIRGHPIGEIFMANYAEIIKKTNENNLVKPQVKLQCRRFGPANRRWTVICENGWPMDRPVSVTRFVSRAEARKIAADFLNEMTC